MGQIAKKNTYFLNVNLKRSKKLRSTLVKNGPWTSSKTIFKYLFQYLLNMDVPTLDRLLHEFLEEIECLGTQG